MSREDLVIRDVYLVLDAVEALLFGGSASTRTRSTITCETATRGTRNADAITGTTAQGPQARFDTRSMASTPILARLTPSSRRLGRKTYPVPRLTHALVESAVNGE